MGIFHCYGNHCWFTFLFCYVLFWFDNLSEIAPVHNTKKHLIFTKLACSATWPNFRASNKFQLFFLRPRMYSVLSALQKKKTHWCKCYVLFWFDNLSEIAPVHNTKKHLIFTKLACSATWPNFRASNKFQLFFLRPRMYSVLSALQKKKTHWCKTWLSLWWEHLWSL